MTKYFSLFTKLTLQLSDKTGLLKVNTNIFLKYLFYIYIHTHTHSSIVDPIKIGFIRL